MSNIKNLLGDMTLEEFEVKRKTVLEKIRNLRDSDENVEMDSDARNLYDIWLEVQGRDFAQKWVKYNGTNGHINQEQVIELAEELINKFIEWLEIYK